MVERESDLKREIFLEHNRTKKWKLSDHGNLHFHLANQDPEKAKHCKNLNCCCCNCFNSSFSDVQLLQEQREVEYEQMRGVQTDNDRKKRNNNENQKTCNEAGKSGRKEEKNNQVSMESSFKKSISESICYGFV